MQRILHHSGSSSTSDAEPAIELGLDHPDRLPPAHQLSNALALATEVHWHQQRKIAGTSFLSHPMLASGMVIKTGGSARAAVITLLHDVVEEGGASALTLIESRFAPSICSAVAQMTPPHAESRLPWAEKKERGLERMRQVRDSDLAMAFAGDKAATLYELQADVQLIGAFKVLNHLRHDCESLLWYYQSCWHALSGQVTASMNTLLRTHVEWLRQTVQAYPR